MKNKICKGIVLALPIICLAVFSACKDPMKDYYDNGKYTGIGTESMLDVLKANPEYSTFVLLLEETGMDQMLVGEDVLTVWAPRNVDMPSEIAHLNAAQKIQFVQNHISTGAITTSDLSYYYVVSTLSERNLSVTSSNGVYYVGGSALVKTNMMCKNGVVQEIAVWFIPRPTLYELLVDLPDAYSIYRDSMLGRTIKVFNKEESVPIATDEYGNPIYDTVWLLENEILDVADISDAALSFTMFIPTNDAMLNMYSDMTNYLNAAQHPLTKADTSKWTEWVLKASITQSKWLYAPNSFIYNNYWDYEYDVIHTGPNSTTSYSLYNYDIDTKYQVAYDETPKLYSNGYAYYLNVVSVPKAMYMTRSMITPYSIRKYGVPGATSDPWGSSYGLDSWTEPMDRDKSRVNDDEKTVRIQFGRENRREDESIKAEYTFNGSLIEYTTPNPDDAGSPIKTLVERNFMPGYYDVSIQLRNSEVDFRESRLDSVKLILNGETIVVRRIHSDLYANGYYVSMDPIYIPGTYAPLEVTLSLFPLDTSGSPAVEAEIQRTPDLYRAWRRIEVGMFRLYPDYNF